MALDLHGLSVEQATSKISLELYSFTSDEYATELLVITGRGTGAMQTTFLNMIDEYDNLYCVEINPGLFSVTKTNY